MTVADDLATLRRALDAKPTNPTRLRWNAYSALARVEAEIGRLEGENALLLEGAESYFKEALALFERRGEAAEAEAARLRDGPRQAVDELDSILLSMAADMDSDAYLEKRIEKVRALLAEDGAA